MRAPAGDFEGGARCIYELRQDTPTPVFSPDVGRHLPLQVALADDLQVVQLVAGDVIGRGADAHRLAVGDS